MKKIENLKMKVSDIKTGFGNPRKLKKEKEKELKKSIERFGNFGIFLIDEHDNVIAGNARRKVICEIDPDTIVDCKRLVGYTESELRAINIKDNIHAGDWDLDMLADWTADLTIDLGIKIEKKDDENRKIKEMELIRYEKYDYVIVACRNELDYNELVRKLGIDGAKVSIPGTNRKIKGRAIWYDQLKCKIKE